EPQPGDLHQNEKTKPPPDALPIAQPRRRPQATFVLGGNVSRPNRRLWRDGHGSTSFASNPKSKIRNPKSKKTAAVTWASPTFTAQGRPATAAIFAATAINNSQPRFLPSPAHRSFAGSTSFRSRQTGRPPNAL